MDPPDPPAEIRDPPSMSRIVPRSGDGRGWVRRGAPAKAADEAELPIDQSVPMKALDRDAASDREAIDARNHLRDAAPAKRSDLDDEAAKTENGKERESSEELIEESVASELPISKDASSPRMDASKTEPEPESPEPESPEPESPEPESPEPESPEPESPEPESPEPESPKSDSSKSESESDSPDQEEVTVRELRIESDGTPIREVQPFDRGDLAADEDDSSEPEKREEAEPAIERDYAGYPKTPIRLTSTVYRIRNSMRQCLGYYFAHPEIANERSNWGMLHSIMVYGADTRIRVGSKSYSAIAWIAGNNACRGQKLLAEDAQGITARSGVGLQGHQAQMLAVFSLCNVPADYPLYAGEGKYSVRDIIKTEQLACKSGEELTFTLIGLSHYLDTDAVWRDAEGQVWDFERLIREELAQSVVGAACGGTHRLMGFAHALRKRRAEGKPISGQWRRAEVYTKDFIAYTYRLQNRDGSFSTDWFEGREDNGNMDRKIQTTGHIVEWLLTVTPDAQLQDPRLVNAVRYLLASMYNEREHDWKIGPKGHALRSLAMYYERVYQSGPAWQSSTMARARATSRH